MAEATPSLQELFAPLEEHQFLEEYEGGNALAQSARNGEIMVFDKMDILPLEDAAKRAIISKEQQLQI